MAGLIYSAHALADLERLTDFLIESDPSAAMNTIDLVEEAVELLKRHLLIGLPVEPPLRELVISRGRTGYLALYSFEPADEVVLILAIRHQRELGYGDDPMS